MKVPNTVESERAYTRRILYDLAHTLEHLGTERWEFSENRQILLRALESHAPVLREIANHIEDVGATDF